MGTDWRDNDPEVEPVVEIYQGHRHNYEHFGAPRSPTEATQIGGYQPAGFIWNALEKGYRLGFESSSDHVSTHLSYAIVYAEDTTRPAIIDAFKKRHCYAATDNILLDVRSGDHLMGDIFATEGEARPRRSPSRGPRRSPSSTSSATTSTLYDRAERPRRDVPLRRRRRQAGRDALLLRPRRAGRRQPRLGLADVDHLREVTEKGP